MGLCGDALAQAAQKLIGSPFRLHGRNRETGLDCIGVVGAALADCGRQVRWPEGYRLRNNGIARWMEFAGMNGLQSCTGRVRRGDVLLTRPGPAQHHLLIALGADGFVHAPAGLRRVVCQQLGTLDPLPAQWRIPPDQEQTWQL